MSMFGFKSGMTEVVKVKGISVRKVKPMAKTISIEYKGEKYTLEYNRNSVKMLIDKYGVNFDSESTLDTVVHLPEFFSCAFAMHHPRMRITEINEILATVSNKTDLLGKLIEMIVETVNALLEDGEEKEGNAVWTANWN